MKMAKRILVAALLLSMLALAKPAPAAAHVNLSFSIGLPFFRAFAGVPGPFYGPPLYAAPACAPRAYVSAPVYGPRVVYAPRRVFVPAYPVYGAREHNRPRVGAHRFRRW